MSARQEKHDYLLCSICGKVVLVEPDVRAVICGPCFNDPKNNNAIAWIGVAASIRRHHLTR